MKTLALLLLALMPLTEAQALRVTDYYTMVNEHLNRRDCAGEGNQIVKGQLYGSDCRPVRKYCPYGVGVRDICIRPCQDAAGGGAYRIGQIVSIPPRRCEWGPLRGTVITQVRIVDRGGGVRDTHIDLFQGFCRRSRGGVCREFEPNHNAVAVYGGMSGSAPGRPAPRVQSAEAEFFSFSSR